MQCCSTWDKGCCSLHHPSIVSFDNLKPKYSVNEDIVVEYTLHGHVQHASTRDWLGIFPRGWTNLQQYLTFEYALVAPRAAASPNRTIIFPRVFHQEASQSIEYQLVYVSREIQVLATSSYFRFVQDDKIGVANQTLHVPCRARSFPSDKPEIHPDRFCDSGWAPPHIVLSDQSLLSLHPSRTIPANSRLPKICKSCGRQRESICGLAVGRARFLATQNASLTERVFRLERDLALAEGTRRSLAERLRAYEGFVGEMLRSLATKGVVKITDASGKEIVLQQLPSDVDPEIKIMNEVKSSTGDENEKQAASKPEIETRELSTNDRALVCEYLSEDKPLLEKERKEGKLSDDFREESVAAEKRINIDVETQTLNVDAKCFAKISKTQNDEDAIDVNNCNEEYKKDQAIVEENQVLEPLENLVDERKVAHEKSGKIDYKSNDFEDEECKTLRSKPSAIVIQGSNVKFAIIRY